ncbi:MAG: DNA recombination protein RmuC [Longicatena sp.]
MDMITIIVGVLIIVLLLVLLLVLRPSKREESELKETLLESERRQQETLFHTQQSMNETMLLFQNQMTQTMRNDLQKLNETTTDRLFSIEKNVNANLTQGYESTSKVFGQVLQQMGKLDESQQNLKEVSLSISHLQSILTDKKTRGIFGEVELYSLLEMAMGDNQKRYAKQYKLSNGSIVDAAIFASEPLHVICVDSKFPLENYNRIMQDDISVEERKKVHNTFVQDVKKHIKAIGDKYIIPEETAEFAYMFLPAEAIFSYIHSNCEDIVRYSYEQKVYLVSPTTLMAYITAIKAIYIGQQRNENIVAIQEALKNLQIEFDRFEKRYGDVSKDFERCYQDMRTLHITTEKLTRRFKDIQEVDLKDKSIEIHDI